MSSRRSPEPSRISLISWLAVGGTGPPPTSTNFCHMASERKAAYREEQAYKEARKAASVEFQAKWPSTGLISGSATKRQKPRDRRELMKLHGPKGTARGRTAEGEGEDGHNREDSGHNDDDDRGARNAENNDTGDNGAGDEQK